MSRIQIQMSETHVWKCLTEKDLKKIIRPENDTNCVNFEFCSRRLSLVRRFVLATTVSLGFFWPGMNHVTVLLQLTIDWTRLEIIHD